MKEPNLISDWKALVANTDRKGMRGEHWVCFYFDNSGNAEYFDSYGMPPANCDLFKFFQSNGHNHKINEVQLQGMTSTVCGHYCIAFIANRARGHSMENIVQRFKGRQSGQKDREVGKLVSEVYDIKQSKTRFQAGGGQKCCAFKHQKHVRHCRK
jgi:hypothetical protein